MSKKILLVEDEADLVMMLDDRLRVEGYQVEAVADGERALALLREHVYDLVLLDVGLPGMSGLDVCQELRRMGSSVPVIMLTARSQVVDKVVGLKLGADDYVTKPFEMMELLARIEVLLRRAQASVPAGPVVEFGDVVVNLRGAEVRRAGEPVALSAREFQLLRYLIEHRGEALGRDQLLRDVWGYESALTTRTVDVHVGWLRQKLEPDVKHPRFIVTLQGIGYKFAG
ncbi:MAG: response regulator transcription factor [Bryobacterales bacterium]|nr:response regulator transcription factor [Bryobacterales bacterium]